MKTARVDKHGVEGGEDTCVNTTRFFSNRRATLNGEADYDVARYLANLTAIRAL